MAVTPSQMLALGTPLPGFSLTDAVSGRPFTEDDFAGRRAVLVMFICNHCPYVKHVVPELGRLAHDYIPEGVAIVAINSNDAKTYPEDAPPNMKRLAVEQGWEFPFLFDEDQAAARAFRAACTPDFYLFDGSLSLVYRGQLDGTRPGGAEPDGADLRRAMDAVLTGEPIPEDQTPSVGCNIKWKRGEEPDYHG